VSTVASVTIKIHRVSGSLPYLCSWVHNGMAITGKVYERHDGWLGADLRKGGGQALMVKDLKSLTDLVPVRLASES
jgi:hypothetical protein